MKSHKPSISVNKFSSRPRAGKHYEFVVPKQSHEFIPCEIFWKLIQALPQLLFLLI